MRDYNRRGFIGLVGGARAAGRAQELSRDVGIGSNSVLRRFKLDVWLTLRKRTSPRRRPRSESCHSQTP